MQVIRDAWKCADPPRHGVVAIGNFDGVHRGQQALLSQLIRRSRELDVPSVVVTFEPHPLAVLDPDKAPPRLTTPDMKLELLAREGVQTTLSIAFTLEFAEVSAETFVTDLLCRRLGAQAVYVGSRFAFGAGRSGNLELMRRLGDACGFETVGVSEIERQGEAVSSTRIRRTLRQGGVEAARDLLGRPYALRGTVSRGSGRGRQLGWPTVNLVPAEQLVPAEGVYVTRIHLSTDPLGKNSVTNIGRRPTFGVQDQPVVESHILDFDRQVYGEALEIHFFHRLRGERAFRDRGELAAQIGLDVQASREYFARGSC